MNFAQQNETPKPPIVPVLEHYGFTGLDAEPHGFKKCVCAFHNERHASASYRTDDGGAFNCFACGVSGDAYAIIMGQEGCTFPEAVKMAQEITGVELGEGEAIASAPKPVRVSGAALLSGDVQPSRSTTGRKPKTVKRRKKRGRFQL